MLHRFTCGLSITHSTVSSTPIIAEAEAVIRLSILEIDLFHLINLPQGKFGQQGQ